MVVGETMLPIMATPVTSDAVGGFADTALATGFATLSIGRIWTSTVRFSGTASSAKGFFDAKLREWADSSAPGRGEARRRRVRRTDGDHAAGSRAA
jgi:hypothetical protein